jgi:hypothetical protein
MSVVGWGTKRFVLRRRLALQTTARCQQPCHVFAQHASRYWSLEEHVGASFNGQFAILPPRLTCYHNDGTFAVAPWILKRRVNSSPLIEPAQYPSVTTMSVGVVVAI